MEGDHESAAGTHLDGGGGGVCPPSSGAACERNCHELRQRTAPAHREGQSQRHKPRDHGRCRRTIHAHRIVAQRHVGLLAHRLQSTGGGDRRPDRGRRAARGAPGRDRSHGGHGVPRAGPPHRDGLCVVGGQPGVRRSAGRQPLQCAGRAARRGHGDPERGDSGARVEHPHPRRRHPEQRRSPVRHRRHRQRQVHLRRSELRRGRQHLDSEGRRGGLPLRLARRQRRRPRDDQAREGGRGAVHLHQQRRLARADPDPVVAQRPATSGSRQLGPTLQQHPHHRRTLLRAGRAGLLHDA